MAKSVKMPDGSVINFPDEMDDATIHSEGMKYMDQAQQRAAQSGDLGNSPAAQGTYERKDVDTGIDIARPFVANAAGGAAAVLAAPTAPFTLGTGPFVARTGAYSVVDALMQYLKEKKPDSPLDAIGEGAKQSLINSGMNKLLQLGGRTVGAIRNTDQPEILNFSPTTSQALKATGSAGSLVTGGAKALEDLSLTAKQKALDRSAGAGFTEALQVAKKNGFSYVEDPNEVLDSLRQGSPLSPGTAATPLRKGQSYSPYIPGSPVLDSFSKIDTVIKDPHKLEDVLTTAQTNGVGFNLKKDLQSYQFSKILQDATKSEPTTGAAVRINPQAIEDTWRDPKMQASFEKLYSSQQRSDIDQFFKNIAYTQDKVNTNPVAKKILMLHGAASLGIGLFTGHISEGVASAAGVIVGAEALGKLLTNPKTARLMVNLAGGGPLGMSDSFAGRILVNALQGETIAIQDAQGQAHPGTLKDGKFVPLQQ